jgi:hypothetical protein
MTFSKLGLDEAKVLVRFTLTWTLSHRGRGHPASADMGLLRRSLS